MEILSTRQVARLLAVSEATVKRWTDEGVLRCYRTPGGHRKFRLAEVREFMATHSFAGAELPNGTGPPSRPTVEGTIALALAADANRLVRGLAAALSEGASLELLLDDVLAPALVRIGDAWACHELEVGHEHVASSTMIELLARLAPVVEGTASRGVAVIACLEGERHDLAARMAGLVCRAEGFRVLIPGADTPAGGVARLVREVRAAVVALSSAGVASLPSSQALAQVLDSARETGARVFAGGNGFFRLAELPAGIERVVDMRALRALLA